MIFPVKQREVRELLIEQDRCPECGAELDTGWECNGCGFDAMKEALATPRQPRRDDVRPLTDDGEPL